ncbi:RNI-like protein [Gonapodya prolifera JEL478]|uniref:RNI-like protein n=1 Tax=Gonapodya prolifera (strain JEL478) TaxID=1344416 RepID=A0A139A223_GONPJ|nr:RNI-like protein [Gonapodya prolifera JEL478]|eukprot:KXS10840.1 RNI-like protein [Gonapodya prolifera JEL478]
MDCVTWSLFTHCMQVFFTDNRIGDDGAQVVADALKINMTLTKLLLRWNHIGVDGARAVADTLKVNTTLTQLILSDNGIGVDGARAVADALKVNKTLTELILEWCCSQHAVLEMMELRQLLMPSKSTQRSRNCIYKGIQLVRQLKEPSNPAQMLAVKLRCRIEWYCPLVFCVLGLSSL